MTEEGNLITIGIEEPQEANSSREEDNSQEDTFNQAAMIIAEAKEKILGTDEERKERERINEEVFQKNISRQLEGASLWFQFHLSFDKKKDFSKLENLSENEETKTLKFWKSWLFSCLEDLEEDRREYLKKVDKLERESQEARNEEYISELCLEVINDEIKIDRRTFIPTYYQIVAEICEDIRKINELLK